MVQDRIIGTEVEYGVMALKHPKNQDLSQLEHEEIRPYIPKALNELGITKLGSYTSYFLGNGARLYQDVSDRREYATPEDVSLQGVVANEIAGEQIVQRATSLYGKDKGIPTFLTKRVIDDHDQTCGYHVSLSADAERVRINCEHLALFGVFAATRSVLFGAGAIRSNGHFVLGQKASQLTTDYSSGTMNDKPVINLRNEPLADPGRWTRVHDTSGDPTMSPWATAVKFGAASIVLRLIENERTMPDLRFDKPLFRVARMVAHDNQLSQEFRLEDGSSMTALGAMKRIVQEARRLEAEGGLSESESWALEEWEKACADMGQNPRLLGNRVEWVVKREALMRQSERHGWAWNSRELMAKDRQFSDLSERGIGRKLRETRWADHMPDSDLLESRLQTAPSSTRAHLRGLFVKHYSRFAGGLATANWSVLKPGQGNDITVMNPFATTHEALRHLEKSAA